MNKIKLIQARIKKIYGKQDGFTRFGIIWLIIISPFWIIPLIYVIYESPYEILKCWPAALFICLLGSLLFWINKYPDKFAKLLVNKVTLFPIKIIVAILMMIPVLIFLYMLCRFCDLIGMAVLTAILKCFWIIK